MFINKIKKNKEKNNTVKILKNSNLPVIIYGAGGYAKQVIEYLKSFSINISGCFVDNAFYLPDKYIDNIKIETYSQICSKYKNFNILVAFYDADSCKKIMDSKSKFAQPVYFLYETIKHYELDYEYVYNNKEKFQELYDFLVDDMSKETLIGVINAKLNETTEPIQKICVSNQYFNNLTLSEKSNEKEILVDCGAFNGDSILEFYKNVDGNYKKIYAFEPNDENVLQLEKNIEKYKLKNIKIIKKGCYNCSSVLRFNNDGSNSSFDDNTDNKIETIAIDDIVGDDLITFIKMDIEGSELKALEGATETIRRCMPKLAICVYHRKEDLIVIPDYIKKITKNITDKKYQFFLRHHSFAGYETVLYAIPSIIKK